MITNAIESAQRKVEGRNFGIRKNVLQYDDVMNQQREIIYGQRDQVLQRRRRVREACASMMEDAIQETVAQYLPPRAIRPQNGISSGLRDHYLRLAVAATTDFQLRRRRSLPPCTGMRYRTF